MKNLSHLAVVGALLSLTSLSYSQSLFVNKPGKQEFTGKMTVRPWSEADWRAKGISAELAAKNVRNALAMLAPYAPRPIAATGEVIITLPANRREDAMHSALTSTGLFQYAEPNWRVFFTAKPNDPQYANQWHHVNMKSEKGWDLHTGHTVKVAICDSGVDLTHPDLAPNLLPGYNSVQKKTQAEGGEIQDVHGHGTHVSGCAAGIGNNGRGIAGMGWNFKILPVKISLGAAGGTTISDAMEGARWAANQGAKVINHSHGGVESASVGQHGTDLKKRGILLVFAGGNNLENIRVDHKDVVVVSGTNKNDQYAGWPAFGVGIDVMAPCENIVATYLGGGYGPMSGTSMASPLVTGAIAQIFSYNPKLTAQQAEDILFKSCTSIGDANKYGWGLVNMEKAMKAVQTTLSVTSRVIVDDIKAVDGTGTGVKASVNEVDSAHYLIEAKRVASGRSASAEFNLTVPNPGRVLTISPKIVGSTTSVRTPAAGTLFLWNWATSTYDRIGEAPLPSLGNGTFTRSFSDASLAKYLSSAGKVKGLFRAYVADRRNTGAAEPFTLRINQVVLMVDSRS